MDYEKNEALLDGYLKTYESLFQMMYNLDFSLIDAFGLDSKEKYLDLLRFLGKKDKYPLDKNGEPVLDYNELTKDQKLRKWAGYGSVFFSLQRVLMQLDYNKEK